jgi:alpha-L-fucosidase
VISLARAGIVQYITLQEYIRLGQRVKSFSVDVWKDNAWQPVASATTIGYKRILKIAPVETSKLRITITDSKACPVISTIEIY